MNGLSTGSLAEAGSVLPATKAKRRLTVWRRSLEIQLVMVLTFSASPVAAAEQFPAGLAYETGVRYYNYGLYKEAQDCFLQAKQLSPDVNVLYYLANCRAQLGDHGQAAALYRQVVASGGSSDAAVWAGQALVRYQEIDRLRAQVAAQNAGNSTAAKTAIARQAKERIGNAAADSQAFLQTVDRAGETAAGRITRIADAEVAEAKARKAQLERILSRSSRGSSSSVNIEPELDAIKAWAAEQKAVISQNTAERVRRERLLESQRETMVNESADNLTDLLAQPQRKCDGARLSPVGTNMYVRNYITASSKILR